MFNQGLCIEKDPKTNGNKLTVYNAEINTHKKLFGFWVKFVTAPLIPRDITYHENHNAYFLHAKGGLFRNLDHCFKDISLTLFQLLTLLGHLKGTNNVLFTGIGRKPKRDFNFGWLDAMNVNTKLYPNFSFHTAKPGTCFSGAVFADSTHSSFRGRRHRPSDVKELTTFLLNAYNITMDSCHKQNARQPTITIIERRAKRKIMNIPDIKSHLANAGYTDVTATPFEKHNLLEQMLLSYCSDVLIGKSYIIGKTKSYINKQFFH